MEPVIVIKAPEGFRYVGYQRVEIHYVYKTMSANISEVIAKLWNALYSVDNQLSVDTHEKMLIADGGKSIFVLGGESYTFEDFKETIKPILPPSFKVILEEGSI